jgi:hypothetical protein
VGYRAVHVLLDADQRMSAATIAYLIESHSPSLFGRCKDMALSVENALRYRVGKGYPLSRDGDGKWGVESECFG